jgi:hypothetical protein
MKTIYLVVFTMTNDSAIVRIDSAWSNYDDASDVCAHLRAMPEVYKTAAIRRVQFDDDNYLTSAQKAIVE